MVMDELVVALLLAVAALLIACGIFKWQRQQGRPRVTSLLSYAVGLTAAAFVAWLGVIVTWASSASILIGFVLLVGAAGLAWLALGVAAVGR